MERLVPVAVGTTHRSPLCSCLEQSFIPIITREINPDLEVLKWFIGVLACALAVAAQPALADTAVDWSRAQLVELVAVEYSFEPNHLVFRHDRPYRLHVENHGRELHELTAPDFFKAVELRNPEVLNQDHTELVLQPGAKKDLYFVALRPGHYDMRCADHDWAGMTGDITVE
jgi:uncharacterized cupredoxin-like copper-binding protein